MKLLKTFIFALLGVALSSDVSRAQLSLNFSSSPGSTIQFNGSQHSFQFNPSSFTGFGGIYTNTQWFIGSESGGTDSAVGLFGAVAHSPFSYGAITVNGAEQSATISGPLGALDIIDGAGTHLTGTVDWVQIQSFDYSGALNASLLVNVTDLSYNGNNQDLKTMVASGLGAMNLSFQFSPGETLSQLSAGTSPFTTSYSGSISPVPEPGSIGLCLLGVGVLFSARRLRQPDSRQKTRLFSSLIHSN
jgi:PEP-CTERM motif